MPETVEIRRFSDNALQAQIDRVLAQVPANKPIAVVAHADRRDGETSASLTAMIRLGDEWSILAAAYKPYKGKLGAEAELVWTP
jgi:hypothetical protein